MYSTMKRIVDYRKTWYRNIVELCTQWKCEELPDIVYVDTLLLSRKIRMISNTVSKIENDSLSRDIVDMRNTKLLKLYSLNKTYNNNNNGFIDMAVAQSTGGKVTYKAS